MIEIFLVGKTLKLTKVKDNEDTNQMTKKEERKVSTDIMMKKITRFCFVLFYPQVLSICCFKLLRLLLQVSG